MFTIVITCKLRQRVYAISQFRFERYLQHIQKYRITVLQIVPPVVVMLGKRPEVKEYDLTSVSYIMCASAPLKSDVQNAVSERLGATIVQSWGMSETTCTGLMIPGTMKDDTGSVGYLLPNTEAMLVDEEGKEMADPEASGELWVRGPQMMKAYLNNASATNETLTPERWLKTGDVAMQKDGKWWIVDRRKELIKVNGFQVAPAELEALLYQHEEVVDAAVVGIVRDGDERPRAYVVLADGAKGGPRKAMKAIQDFVAGKVVKHKRIQEIAAVEEIPRLLSGKIQRKVVKQWARDEEKRTDRKSGARL
jgi:acyl-coenzyme A synthetase/AMP-(fatty) acid ligase